VEIQPLSPTQENTIVKMMFVSLFLTDTLMICVPLLLIVILELALPEYVLEKLLELLAIEITNVWQAITATKRPMFAPLNLPKTVSAFTADNVESLSPVLTPENVSYRFPSPMDPCA
jgi:hypothetical protein